MPVHRYVEENGLATMLATRRSVGITPEVNLWECITYMPLLGRYFKKEKGLCPPTFFQNEEKKVVNYTRK